MNPEQVLVLHQEPTPKVMALPEALEVVREAERLVADLGRLLRSKESEGVVINSVAMERLEDLSREVHRLALARLRSSQREEREDAKTQND